MSVQHILSLRDELLVKPEVEVEVEVEVDVDVDVEVKVEVEVYQRPN